MSANVIQLWSRPPVVADASGTKRTYFECGCIETAWPDGCWDDTGEGQHLPHHGTASAECQCWPSAQEDMDELERRRQDQVAQHFHGAHAP